jgi:hypothetical protein
LQNRRGCRVVGRGRGLGVWDGVALEHCAQFCAPSVSRTVPLGIKVTPLQDAGSPLPPGVLRVLSDIERYGRKWVRFNCQARGRRFETDHPLHKNLTELLCLLKIPRVAKSLAILLGGVVRSSWRSASGREHRSRLKISSYGSRSPCIRSEAVTITAPTPGLSLPACQPEAISNSERPLSMSSARCSRSSNSPETAECENSDRSADRKSSSAEESSFRYTEDCRLADSRLRPSHKTQAP